MSDPAALDAADPLAGLRDAFHLPEGVIYLDGNSLGPLPKRAAATLRDVVEREWGESLIRGWTAHGWVDLPERLGDRIGRLIGAAPGATVVCDSTSVNVFKLLAAAMRLRPGRDVILSDEGNFPTDLYIAEGLIELIGRGRLRRVPRESVLEALDAEVAVALLTQVDYRSGAKLDLAATTARVHAAGAVMLWDLAHSTGAFPVDLAESGAEFAVGCGYKYLNGGPGAPAFLYVRPDLADGLRPALSGWFGHAAPFAFDPSFRPAPGVGRLRVGTPPILSMRALDAALDVFDMVDLADLAAKSRALSELFIAEVERRVPPGEIALASPRDPAQRGSQVSFRCPHGYAVVQALIAEGVIGDFRAPDLMRFGFAPLYLRFADVADAAFRLAEILHERRWDRPEHHIRASVT
ncbi:MAG: kynureninase [Rubrimonas sp.]|uniref:kynureninase n=1 Tax=Rubrimonas sp. TaxID=2036015 RepID=UPI002FDEBBC6